MDPSWLVSKVQAQFRPLTTNCASLKMLHPTTANQVCPFITTEYKLLMAASSRIMPRVAKLELNTALKRPLGCGDIGDSYHGCADTNLP